MHSKLVTHGSGALRRLEAWKEHRWEGALPHARAAFPAALWFRHTAGVAPVPASEGRDRCIESQQTACHRSAQEREKRQILTQVARVTLQIADGRSSCIDLPVFI